jgi:hypothetical protein
MKSPLVLMYVHKGKRRKDKYIFKEINKNNQYLALVILPKINWFHISYFLQKEEIY